ncbi:hypothetical protein FACS1894190_15320 [Spirochaetia bacterium]|nr:hypothetical protein FACS1894190_15320 [Spirochaetia bacterium]
MFCTLVRPAMNTPLPVVVFTVPAGMVTITVAGAVGVGVAGAVGVGVAGAVGVGVADGIGVGVAVGVAVTVGVGVAVGVDVAVGIGQAVHKNTCRNVSDTDKILKRLTFFIKTPMFYGNWDIKKPPSPKGRE